MKRMSDSVPLRKSFNIIKLSIILYLLCTLASYGEPSEIHFLRATDSALQTSVYTLISKDSNVRLKIIGVVHVADKEYYSNIQKIINDLDFLYYEGIRVNSNYQAKILNDPIMIIAQTQVENKLDVQSYIAKFLNFADQREHLKPMSNWINADMEFSQFVSLLRTNKIEFDSISGSFNSDRKSILKDYSEILSLESTESADYNLRIAKFKKKMSENLVKSAIDLCYLDEMRVTREAIILERNKVALSYVKPKLNSKFPIQLGILYGAAHTPNFVEILTHDYNFAIESYEWLDAWSLQN